MNRRRLYFAYGSNLDADQMQSRCPSSSPRFRARLHHHRLDFTYFSSRWNGGAADVVPHSGAEVWGVVYELDEADLSRLDRFEGGYDRVYLEVRSDREELVRVTSYTVRVRRNFAPGPIYLDKMLTWGLRWEFPDAYLERLRRLRGL